MGSKLYVGNLSYNTTSSDLEQLFGQHGTVQSAEVISDRETGRSKGFGFVEMGSDAEAQAAIAALNGQEKDGRPLTVNEARPKPDGGGHPAGGGLFRCPSWSPHEVPHVHPRRLPLRQGILGERQVRRQARQVPGLRS